MPPSYDELMGGKTSTLATPQLAPPPPFAIHPGARPAARHFKRLRVRCPNSLIQTQPLPSVQTFRLLSLVQLGCAIGMVVLGIVVFVVIASAYPATRLPLLRPRNQLCLWSERHRFCTGLHLNLLQCRSCSGIWGGGFALIAASFTVAAGRRPKNR